MFMRLDRGWLSDQGPCGELVDTAVMLVQATRCLDPLDRDMGHTEEHFGQSGQSISAA